MKSVLIRDAKLTLIRGDITKEEVDAIVNAANSSLMGGGGVDGAIHRAGGPAILEECKAIVARQGRLPAGQAVITTGGNLPAAHVIHTVGPIWHGGDRSEAKTLKSAYLSSLEVARENGVKRIAFPSISTGAYRYPLEAAAKVALGTVTDYLKESDWFKEVRFVLLDADTHDAYSRALGAWHRAILLPALLTIKSTFSLP